MSFYQFNAEPKFSIKFRDSNYKLLYHSSINKHGFSEISSCDNSALIIWKERMKIWFVGINCNYSAIF
jgi:hypothetical protein